MAWQQNIEADVVANIPGTSARVNGALFFATDEQKVYRNDLGGSGWVEVLAGGGGAAWALVGGGYTATGIWDQSVDGTTASPLTFTGLSSYNEIMVIVVGLDKTSSSTIRVQVGHGGGPTFLTGTEYQNLADNGDVPSGVSTLSLNSSSDTDPVTAWCSIRNFNLAVPKPTQIPNRTDGSRSWLINDTNQMTAVRVQTSSGSGDFNAGKVYVLGR